jgi:hypothetical protein
MTSVVGPTKSGKKGRLLRILNLSEVDSKTGKIVETCLKCIKKVLLESAAPGPSPSYPVDSRYHRQIFTNME